MERIHSAKELFLNTLINMGIKYESHNYEDTIWFDYQDMDFEAEEDKGGRYITLEYMDWKELHDAEEALRMRRIINKVNRNSDVVISTTVKFTYYRRKILFIEEIPNIEDYLRSELQELMRVYKMVNEALQKDNENEKSGKWQPIDIESTQTKDLFIKTIREMGCDYEPWKDEESRCESIVFDYQTETYRATFFEVTKKVLLENHYSLYNVALNDMDKVNQLREVVNKVNQEHDAVTVYTIDCVTNKMYAEASHTVPFMAEIPNLLTYLHSILNDLYFVRMDIKCEMEADEIEEQWIMDREAN